MIRRAALKIVSLTARFYDRFR